MALDHKAQVEEFAGKLPKNIRVFARKEVKKLPGLLEEDERIEALAQGRYQGKQGIVTATDRRVLFVEEGVLRSNLEDFGYDRISSIQTQSGMMFGKVTIFASGNKAEIDQIAPKQMATSLADVVRAKIKAPSKGSTSASDGETALDKLKKLGELKESGVISAKEFNDQKKKLMEQL